MNSQSSERIKPSTSEWPRARAASGVALHLSVSPRTRKNTWLSFAIAALGIGFVAPVAILSSRAASVLDGQTIRILAIGDPVFQVMQKIHDDMEKMAGGKIELEVRPFDVLHQQVLLNAQNATSNYHINAVDLPQFGEYRSFLLDLNPLIKDSAFDATDFQEAAWTGAQVDGKQLGIPIQPMAELLAYRKDLFEEAGLQPPMTTDDVLAAAKKLHNSRPGLAGIAWNGARGTPLGQAFIQIMGSFGQAPIDLRKTDHGFSIDNIKPQNMKPMIDTPAGLATARYLKALMDYSSPGILNMAWDETARVFGRGDAAMTYIWSGRSAIFELDPQSPARGKVGYVLHPHGPNAAPVSPLGGWSLGIPANLDKSRVPLAWTVVTWLTSADMMKEYTKHAYCVSPRHSVSQDPTVVAHCPVIPEVDAIASKGELAEWQRPPVPELQQIVDVLGSVMHEMLAGKRTPDDAVKEAQQEIDRIMRKAGYY
jgi:multiple sugar transport system substrate-binding protein